MILVDADNAFNNLNRKTALLNIKALCPPLYTFINNTYKSPSQLYVNNSSAVLSSEEITTKGDPDAMAMFSIGSRPLIDQLDRECETERSNRGWYADDGASVGTLGGVKAGFDLLSEIGPGYGY